VLPEDTHIANLHLTLANKMDVKADRFAGSTNVITNL